MSDMPYELLAWIKKDQAERLVFALNRAKRNYADDTQYMLLLEVLVEHWNKLKQNDKIFINSLKQRHDNRLCFTGAQRSAITSMWMKYTT